mgnify:FL=1
MASKRRLRRRACEGKLRYVSHAQAHAAISAQTWKWTAHMSAYPCPHCGRYHIGHTPRR